MAASASNESDLDALGRLWSKLQERLSSSASSSARPDVPNLKKLNDMVYEVHCPLKGEKPDLEIVFFHGLQIKSNQDAHITTWMSRDNSEYWLQTWLVKSFPKARILSVSYDSSSEMTPKLGRLDMYCTGENLVSDLTMDEVEVGQAGCPVVLVGHCLGGLVLKELCLSARSSMSRKGVQGRSMERVQNLFWNLKGMFFYGTPHVGSVLGDKLNYYFQGALLKDIEILKDSTARRNYEFSQLRKQFRWATYGIGEVLGTYVECLGEHVLIVPEASARLDVDDFYSLAADHYDICKPKGQTDNAFRLLTNFLRKIRIEGVHDAKVMANFKSGRGYVIDQQGRAGQVESMLVQKNMNSIFIVGLSGIGKTTLAKQVFHHIGHMYAVTCFVSLDEVEASRDVQDDVLKKVQNELDRAIGGSGRNLSSMYHLLKTRKILMVLDNVVVQSQLDALQSASWLDNNSSKLIITTNNPTLGGPSNTYEVPKLSLSESHKLFCHYAFRGKDEPDILQKTVRAIIYECDNHPLFIEVLGGYAKTLDVGNKEVWLDLVKRLKKAQEVGTDPSRRLWAKFRFLYDTLEVPDQEVFLDIATVFQGFSLSVVKCIWRESRDSPDLAWHNLKGRCLVKEDSSGSIRMHQLLRNLGERIACPTGVQVDKLKRIPRLSPASLEFIEQHQGIVETVAVKLPTVENHILTLRNRTFVKCTYLEYLILDGVSISGNKLTLPGSLVYLRWTGGLFIVCPVDFTNLKKLVVLELLDCKSMRDLPRDLANAIKLKRLELEGCQALIKLPVGLPNSLEHLGAKRTGLKQLPGDVGRQQNLRDLLVSSPQLTSVPQGLGRLEMLISLNLSGTGVTTLPESIENLKCLKKLDLSGTMLCSLPSSIGGLRLLEEMYLTKARLTSLPESLGDLKCLRKLHLSDTPLATLPDSVGDLQNLRSLRLGDTMLCSLPSTIGRLRELQDMWLQHTHLKELPESVGDLVSLQILWLDNTLLETVPDSVCKLRRLRLLHLGGTHISALPDAIGDLAKLAELNVHSTGLTAWPQTTASLLSLHIFNGPLPIFESCSSSLESEAGGRGQETALAVRDGRSEFKMDHILQLSALQGMQRLYLTGRDYPQSSLQPLFSALQQMSSLNKLRLTDFNLAEMIPDELGTLTTLEYLTISGWERLRVLPESLGKLLRLRDLSLHKIPKLCMESLSAVRQFLRLEITDCGSLQGTSLEAVCTARDNQGKPSATLGPAFPPRRQVEILESDSWRVVQCFLKGSGMHFAKTIVYLVECQSYEKARKRRTEGIASVLEAKAAMELFPEMRPGPSLTDQGQQEDSGPSTSRYSCSCNYPYCKIHRRWHCKRVCAALSNCENPGTDIQKGGGETQDEPLGHKCPSYQRLSLKCNKIACKLHPGSLSLSAGLEVRNIHDENDESEEEYSKKEVKDEEREQEDPKGRIGFLAKCSLAFGLVCFALLKRS